jgi:hypothetical protein
MAAPPAGVSFFPSFFCRIELLNYKEGPFVESGGQLSGLFCLHPKEATAELKAACDRLSFSGVPPRPPFQNDTILNKTVDALQMAQSGVPPSPPSHPFVVDSLQHRLPSLWCKYSLSYKWPSGFKFGRQTKTSGGCTAPLSSPLGHFPQRDQTFFFYCFPHSVTKNGGRPTPPLKGLHYFFLHFSVHRTWGGGNILALLHTQTFGNG